VTVATVALLLLLVLGIFASQSTFMHPVRAANVSPSGGPTVEITPANITDLAKPQGSSFTVNVNVSNSPHINSFETIIYYNNSILQANSMDFSQGVLGSDSKDVVYCIDKTAPIGHSCPSQAKYEQDGEIALAVNKLSGFTDNITRGSLFLINFSVKSVGLGQIHIHSVTLGVVLVVGGVGSPQPALQVSSVFDGFFTNLPCGGGKACQPPVVRVNVSPSPAPKDSTVSFNVTVTIPNPGAKALSYLWNWQDGKCCQPQDNSTSPPIGQPELHPFLSSQFGLDTSCINRGLCLVELTVYDSRGVSWQTTVPVQIQLLNIVLTVGDPSVFPFYRVLPGTIVKITARIDNIGNVNVNATLRIRLETIKTLAGQYFPLLAAAGGERTLDTTWDTTGFTPRAYAIVAEVYNTSALVGTTIVHSLNATSLPLSSSYVLLVSQPVSGGLSLSIIQTTGLGILIVVAVVVALTRFFRKPSYLEEP
jgi:Cohesin domain